MTQPPYRGLDRSFLEEEGVPLCPEEMGGAIRFQLGVEDPCSPALSDLTARIIQVQGEAHQELEQGGAGMGNLGDPLMRINMKLWLLFCVSGHCRRAGTL